MDTVLWQTEQFPHTEHFLQLLLLCGADVEERGDNVSEEPEEGDPERER